MWASVLPWGSGCTERVEKNIDNCTYSFFAFIALKVREFVENNLSWGLLAVIDGMTAELSLIIIGRLMNGLWRRKKDFGTACR